MEPGARLREAFASPQVTLMALVGDALTARLAEMAGFEAASLGTAPVTNGLLGLPDAGLLTLTEMEFVVARAAAACHFPILVGAETGYGNAINMARAIRTLDLAGAAGAFIEDKQHPALSPSGGPLVPSFEMVGKVKAAVDSRLHDSFVVIARTDAAHSEGLESVIERGRLYVEAGADGFFFSGVPIEQKHVVLKEVPARFHIAVLGEHSTVTDLHAAGYCAVLTNHAPTHAGALTTFRQFERILRTGRSGDAEFRRDASGTPLEHWEKGDHGSISRFDIDALKHRYLSGESDY
jgi:2-methylisocitrate lyase-like PEP mutase family enzyme